MKKYTITASSFLLLIVLGGARQVAADEVTKWNEIANDSDFDGPIHSRINAMTHAAIHDALYAINPSTVLTS